MTMKSDKEAATGVVTSSDMACGTPETVLDNGNTVGQ